MMMYLSRLILNPRSRRVQREIAAPYELHRTIMRAFPDNLDSSTERVLYRLDADPHQGSLILLAQSQTMPDWSWLEQPETRGYLALDEQPNPAVKPFSPTFSTGQVLAFRLRANPTKRLCHGHDGQNQPKDNVRVPIYDEQEQRAWIERKAEQAGFSILGVRVQSEGLKRLFRGKGERPIQLVSTLFDGFLRVNDPQRFMETVRLGIGSGKGFGFGLLSLARPEM